MVMAKRGLKLTVKVPNFNKDSKEWRRGINRAVAEAQERNSVTYKDTDKLDVPVQFYLRNPKLTLLDLDNRLKDVFDALQGFIGEKGKRGILKKIVPNDNQIYRLVAEKRIPPKSNREAYSTIVIRQYHEHRGTASSARDTRKRQPAKT
jgi:Holliday junction resolvase RusA-like endonuclease